MMETNKQHEKFDLHSSPRRVQGVLSRKYLGAALLAGAAILVALFALHRWRTAGFDWSGFAAVLHQIDWTWLAVSLTLVLTTYVGRALRWEIMLRPLRKNASIGGLFAATAIGFTAVVLFGRAGEPVRPYLIAKREKVSFSSQVAAWLIERILDLLMILLIFGVALTQVSRSGVQPGPRIRLALQAGGYTAGFTGVACLALLIGMRQFRGNVQGRLLEALSFLPEAMVERIRSFLGSFEEGMQCMRSSAFTVLLIAYTVGIWGLIAGSFACILRAFPATSGLGITSIVILMGFVAFGSALQIPGVGGGMQIATVLVLTELFGIKIETASGIALVLWIVTFVAIVPLGLALAFQEGLKWRNFKDIKVVAEGKT